MPKNIAVILTTFALCLACGDDPADEDVQDKKPAAAESAVSTITGNVILAESIGLTPDSRLEVMLQDVSLADAPATMIAKQDFPNPGQSPMAFTLEYDPALIDERHSYGVSARVYDREHLIFVSDSFNPVITHGASNKVVVKTVRVRSSKMEVADVPFIGTTWLLRTAGGISIQPDPERSDAYLLATSNDYLGGYSGCNRFNGDYSMQGEAIEIGNLAVTMMACPDSGEIEKAFLKALADVDTIRVTGRTLRAYSQGAIVASFEAGR